MARARASVGRVAPFEAAAFDAAAIEKTLEGFDALLETDRAGELRALMRR